MKDTSIKTNLIIFGSGVLVLVLLVFVVPYARNTILYPPSDEWENTNPFSSFPVPENQQSSFTGNVISVQFDENNVGALTLNAELRTIAGEGLTETQLQEIIIQVDGKTRVVSYQLDPKENSEQQVPFFGGLPVPKRVEASLQDIAVGDSVDIATVSPLESAPFENLTAQEIIIYSSE
ncbi:MAG: hypothetical protein COU90_00305 [Candidatus Ryanbacteria bacterium CG10_big_fil_rev_8_21_14_0_10_43_42]|uniref:Uncharacterized protein n=1 Tax=Candidatus Ryanbacteria bacterium CG10_big_fil_rev_8_21_14_0_10_43_42 TaxID=1974864 RepID=A0A2M8KXU7_9BACT|nr:MAG: hypothetical protein COU90_00305 [Candidatus Ryanbacteria bacterium CG10_big_fil_rev_8_21_14_0_10_43_42]